MSTHSVGRRRAFVLVFLALSSLVGCRDESRSASGIASASGGYKIVCTTGMVADLARHLAGDRAEVFVLYGAVDPHTYEPTQRDIQQILEADVVLYSGLLLEGPTQAALESAGQRGKLVRAVTKALEDEAGYLRYPDGVASHPDPHVWHDVAAWGRCALYVGEVLAGHDPADAPGYRQRARDYQAQLAAVDLYAKERIATIPEQQRYLVTAHDAFEYFSRRYAIPVRSVQGITTESEAGIDDINRLVDFLVANKVPAVFVEATVNEANLQAVIQGAERRQWTVSVAGTLYSDSMGAPGTYEGTYIGMIDHNVTRIVRALGGDAPEAGLNGKLQR